MNYCNFHLWPNYTYFWLSLLTPKSKSSAIPTEVLMEKVTSLRESVLFQNVLNLNRFSEGYKYRNRVSKHLTLPLSPSLTTHRDVIECNRCPTSCQVCHMLSKAPIERYIINQV